MLTSVSVGSLPMAFAAAPNSPTELFENGPPTTNTIPLKWKAPAGGDAPTGYRIDGALEDPETMEFGSFTVLVADTGNVTTHTITGLNPGDFYELRISAFNDDGASSPSMTFMQGTAFEEGHDFSEKEQDFQQGTYSGPLT
ncbi:MAG: fibronectin type III domain-containing protein, partial [Candidatus Nitrosopelagicus sp.]|nr:fibronectin type III domain-containing protein [Candidatus Nitrosopelagicus sp.]